MSIIFGAESLAATWQNPQKVGYGKPIVAYQTYVTIAGFSSDISSVTITDSLRNLWAPDTATIFNEQASNKYIQIQNAQRYEVDYVGLARIQILGQCRITAQVYFDSGDLTWYPLTPWESPSGSVALFLFRENYRRLDNPAQFLPVTAPAFRVEFATVAGNVKIGHARLGKFLRLERGNFVGLKPTNWAEITDVVDPVSETGEYLGRFVKRRYRRARIEQQNNSEAFVQQNVVPLIEHINGRSFETSAKHSFFYTPRPEQPVGTAVGKEVIYCWPKGNIQPEYTHPNKFMKWGVDVEAIL